MANDTLDLGSWCILRMASVDTLRVHDSLSHAGFQVWTPIERRSARRAAEEKRAALMPSYIFAHVAHIPELARLAMVPNREHPRFSMFRHAGGFPLVADIQLATLRYEEARRNSVFEKLRRRGKKGPQIDAGTTIRLSEGPFAGLTGIVDGQDGQWTLVSYEGWAQPVQIASVLLEEEVVGLARAA